MRLSSLSAWIALGASVLAVSGCGGSESSAPTVTGVGGTASSATTGGAIPPELLGTWTTSLKKADLPADVPPELANAATKWRLEIAETGGTDNGPVLSIVNPDLGQLEGPTLEVAGDRLKLLQEECAAGGDIQFFDNEYSYEVQGDTLTINVVTNQCADRVAETILTSEPWNKAG
jgi:hypothetical protein